MMGTLGIEIQTSINQRNILLRLELQQENISIRILSESINLQQFLKNESYMQMILKFCTMRLFDPFDKRINLSAYDRVDGDITDKIKVVENNVDSSIPGKYQVTYEVK